MTMHDIEYHVNSVAVTEPKSQIKKPQSISLGDDGYGERLGHAPDGVLVDGVTGSLVSRAAVYGERGHATRLDHPTEGERLIVRGQQTDLTCRRTGGGTASGSVNRRYNVNSGYLQLSALPVSIIAG